MRYAYTQREIKVKTGTFRKRRKIKEKNSKKREKRNGRNLSCSAYFFSPPSFQNFLFCNFQKKFRPNHFENKIFVKYQKISKIKGKKIFENG